MKIGYARVSDKDQNEERQIVKFKELGIEDRFIFVDKLSGKSFDRPDYKRMIASMREGDLIYIDALDRLGRNYDGIIKEWKYITRDLKADIVILENEILFDSRKFKGMGDIGRLLEDQFLSLMSYVAEQERKKIRQRQAEGIKLAKAKNKHMGRPKVKLPEDFHNVYFKWKEGKLKAVEAMRILKLKRATFYKKVKEYEARDKEKIMEKQKEVIYKTQDEIIGEPRFKVDELNVLLAAAELIANHTGIEKEKLQFFIKNFGIDMIMQKPSMMGITNLQEKKIIEIGKIIDVLRGQNNG